MSTVYDFEAQTITGEPVKLDQYRGKVLADRQHGQQVRLHTAVRRPGEAVAEPRPEGAWWCWAFRATSLASQDPGANDEIASFCQLNYGVSFPMMAKVDVNGSQAHPLYQWLVKEAPGILGTKSVKWNFTKFLIGRDGQVLGRYAPTDAPKSLIADIEKALAA
jgi:glutathione peroxidase